MSNSKQRQCPTRADGADPLIAQLIVPAVCDKRQERRYHKCATCVHAAAVQKAPSSDQAQRRALIRKVIQSPAPPRLRVPDLAPAPAAEPAAAPPLVASQA